MLQKCRRDQWSVADLDWSVRPRAMSPEDEEAVVQYFTNMAGIERLAGALFEVQRRMTYDPTLAAIFESFVVDEIRHSHVAQMLADHYDRRKLRTYALNEHLVRFTPHFVGSIARMSPDIANAYITSGELILDIALLRSLDDFVDDEMSHQAMHLINRDESRHIAIDFHMAEYYSSEEYRAQVTTRPRPSPLEQLRAWRDFASMLYLAAPFFRAVFFEPMDLTDPTGKRMRQAFKWIQVVAQKPRLARMPFTRFMRRLQLAFNHPIAGRLFGPAIARIIGVDPRVLVQLYTEAEERHVKYTSLERLAQEALQEKTRP